MVRTIEISHESNGERETVKFQLDKIKSMSREDDMLSITWVGDSHSDYINGKVESLR